MVSIEEIAPGDEVWAYDSVTGELRLAEVIRVFEREVHEVWILTIGDAVIVTTAEHRFFVVPRGWVEVRDLQPGELLKSLDGATVRLDDVEREQRTIRVYNFEVR
ncbi:MAG: hypothetical protein GY842_22630, partial [bacterium]|nr:hypothetical protein [bacterium]